jgi:hypothetical protein
MIGKNSVIIQISFTITLVIFGFWQEGGHIEKKNNKKSA